MSFREFSEAERYRVITPLGPAMVYGIACDLPDPEWLTYIDATGEAWWWTSAFHRRAPNITNGYRPVTAFRPVNHKTQEHIDRYKRTGLLPMKYDPTDVSTWSHK